MGGSRSRRLWAGGPHRECETSRFVVPYFPSCSVYSSQDISRGIGYGFIAYTLLKLASGKWREVHPLMYIVSALFALSFVL